MKRTIDSLTEVNICLGSNGDQEWTTRFGIVPNANTNLTAEPESTQPDGQAIPWGNGTLASNSTTNSTASSAVSSSADVVAAAASAPTETLVPIVQALAETSSGSIVKPMLSFVAAGVAGYMWM